MTSPLLEFANAYIFLDSQDDVTVVNGRLTTVSNSRVVLRAFLKRESGAAGGVVPAVTVQDTSPLPGTNGQGFRHSGYVLQYGVLQNPSTPDEMPTTWLDITGPFPVGSMPDVAFQPGRAGSILLGTSEALEPCVIESSSGKFSGGGIDEVVYEEVQGIPVLVIAGRVFGA